MLSALPEAAKEEMLSLVGATCADPAALFEEETRIRARTCQGKKLHQGFAAENRALFLGQSFSNSASALGFQALTVENRVRSRCTGKERDTESGLDNFGKRYYGSSMGRFMTTDPVVITTERLLNPQQLNLYAYVANNPLRFIDPTGEILQCVGDDKSRSQCFSDLQQIAGDAANRLSMDAKTGVVSFDTKDLDLSKNAGAALVNDLVGSKNTFDFSVGPTIMTDKGPVRIDKIHQYGEPSNIRRPTPNRQSSGWRQ